MMNVAPKKTGINCSRRRAMYRPMPVRRFDQEFTVIAATSISPSAGRVTFETFVE